MNQPRGFATLTAVATLTLLGVCLGAITTLLAADARRTRHDAATAQLRQLLLAGQVAAAHHLATGELKPSQNIPVPLPASLRADGFALELHVPAATPTDATVEVHAQVGATRLIQSLHYRREAAWTLSAAALGN